MSSGDELIKNVIWATALVISVIAVSMAITSCAEHEVMYKSGCEKQVVEEPNPVEGKPSIKKTFWKKRN